MHSRHLGAPLLGAPFGRREREVTAAGRLGALRIKNGGDSCAAPDDRRSGSLPGLSGRRAESPRDPRRGEEVCTKSWRAVGTEVADRARLARTDRAGADLGRPAPGPARP